MIPRASQKKTLWYALGLYYFAHFDSSITQNDIVDFVNHFGGSHFIGRPERCSSFVDVRLRLIVCYVPRRIMRVITRRASMLAGDRSQSVAEAKPRRSRGVISSASILSESRYYPNCAHWRVFYFMWLRRIYEFLCVHSNPIWKGRNCCDYRSSHLTFREYFRLFWFFRSCVE